MQIQTNTLITFPEHHNNHWHGQSTLGLKSHVIAFVEPCLTTAAITHLDAQRPSAAQLRTASLCVPYSILSATPADNSLEHSIPDCEVRPTSCKRPVLLAYLHPAILRGPVAGSNFDSNLLVNAGGVHIIGRFVHKNLQAASQQTTEHF